MFCNHYQNFDLSNVRDFKKFNEEMISMYKDYGQPQSKYVVGPPEMPFVTTYTWFVYDKCLDIYEIFTIVVYNSKFLKGGVLCESK